MRLKVCTKIVLLLSVLFTVDAFGYDVVGDTKINYVENGWSGNGLAIHADHGIAGCSAPDTEFSIDATHPSYKELVSIALTAFTTQAKVQIVVDTGVCLFGNRTKVLAIRLLR